MNNNIHVSKITRKREPVLIVEENLQTHEVSWKVTSYEDGSALPGVNVVEKGADNGAVTDISGNYQLQISKEATLVFSSVVLRRRK